MSDLTNACENEDHADCNSHSECHCECHDYGQPFGEEIGPQYDGDGSED